MAAAYLAVAWLCLQVVDILADAFQWPAWTLRYGALLLGAGLPITLIGAWYRRDVRRRARREIVLIGALALTIAAGLSVAPLVAGAGRPGSLVPPAGSVRDSLEPGRTAVAVLPFTDRSGEAGSEYLAAGMHEEILTSLSRIRDLRVASRASVRRYADDRARDHGAIARALDVSALLEGSVRRDGDRVRLSVQLVDPGTRSILWADRYDLQAATALEVQSQVAEKVARALRASLTATERRRLTRPATTDPEAYDFYLRARERIRRPGYQLDDLLEAERFYEAAIARDTNFALAYAHLGSLHNLMYRFALDNSPERRERARLATERALRLDPDLPEAHVSRGYYLYQVEKDYGGSLEAFRRAREILPDDARVLAAMGYIHRRLGRWEEAVANLEGAARLDPTNPDHHLALASTYKTIRRYASAEAAYRRTIEVSTRSDLAAIQRGRLHLVWHGTTDSLRAALAAIPEGDATERLVTYAEYWLQLYDGRYEAALRALERGAATTYDGLDYVRPVELLQAWAEEARGESGAAERLYAVARERLEARARQRPDDPRVWAALGHAYAGLGWKTGALAAGRKATELEPETRNAMYGPAYAIELALIRVRIGETAAAAEEVERLLTVPGGLTAAELHLDPRWTRLREDPGFRSPADR